MTREERVEATIRATFPDAEIPSPVHELGVGAFDEWDSLGHYNLMLALEEEFEVRFSPAQLSEVDTFERIVAALAALEQSG